ncbi:uncharacterized protein LOC115075993 [Rhinatrema bivittatum]|uniref:uncharacterized protein LOC115075993 n=1 Tax=Rhinatrema bivittatum TaxID=194408 RepID=UPI00112826CA|nr:uncharacterized protein LOC115075993 [Rhinatrema bivittatum]
MAPCNMTWIKYPSHDFLNPSISIEDVIASQSIISRALHCYVAFFIPAGLIAGLLILAIFFRHYSRHKTSEKLAILMLDLVITDIAIVLFSFTTISRPNYLEATNLSCGLLSFVFNIFYFNSQFLQTLMLFLLLLQGNEHRASLVTGASPLLWVSLPLALAFLGSLVAVALLGTAACLHEKTYCQTDPLNAWPEYDIVKFSFGFAIPSFFNVVFLVLILVKLVKAEALSKENVPSPTVMLCIGFTTLACRLFYNVMLLHRTALKLQRLNGSPREELIMNAAELVLFSESSVTLLFVLFLHKPYKDAAWSSIQYLRQKCRRNETANSSGASPAAIEIEDVNVSRRSHTIPAT